MRFSELDIPGVFRIDPEPIEDERGFFARIFCRRELVAAGLDADLVQCNNSLTRQAGTIRGLHFQRPPPAETKIIRCLRGAIWDVAVDLRAGSATYGKWCGLELTEENRAMLYVPQGCAHGFQVLEPNTELLYFHSQFYSPQHEGGVHPLDASLGITWPLAVAGLSHRDRQLVRFDDVEPIAL